MEVFEVRLLIEMEMKTFSLEAKLFCIRSVGANREVLSNFLRTRSPSLISGAFQARIHTIFVFQQKKFHLMTV